MSSLLRGADQLLDATGQLGVGEAAERESRAPAQDVFRSPCPLPLGGVDRLCGDVGRVGSKRLEQRRVGEGGLEHLGGQRAVEAEEVGAQRRADLGGETDAVEPRCPRKRPRFTVDAV